VLTEKINHRKNEHVIHKGLESLPRITAVCFSPYDIRSSSKFLSTFPFSSLRKSQLRDSTRRDRKEVGEETKTKQKMRIRELLFKLREIDRHGMTEVPAAVGSSCRLVVPLHLPLFWENKTCPLSSVSSSFYRTKYLFYTKGSLLLLIFVTSKETCW